EVEEPRNADCIASTEGGRNRLQAVLPIESLILQRIEDVEAGNPAEHRPGEREEPRYGVAPPTCNGQVRSHRRNRQRKAEYQVRPASESLGIGVEEDPGQGERCK